MEYLRTDKKKLIIIIIILIRFNPLNIYIKKNIEYTIRKKPSNIRHIYNDNRY